MSITRKSVADVAAAGESAADDILRSGFDRWTRLEEAKAEVGDDLKALFAELKANGFDPKALRTSFRRVRDMHNTAQLEHDALVGLYVASLTGARPAHDAREMIEEFDAETGEIIAEDGLGNLTDDQIAQMRVAAAIGDRINAAELLGIEFDPETGEITDRAVHETDGEGAREPRRDDGSHKSVPDGTSAATAAARGTTSLDGVEADVDRHPIQESAAVSPDGCECEVVTPSSDVSVTSREVVDAALPAIIPTPSAGGNTGETDSGLARQFGSEVAALSPETAAESTARPRADAEVTTPEANTHGQTGTADARARSHVPANAEAEAKQVGQSEQEAAIEPPVDTNSTALADVDQGIDRRPPKPEVAGSNPAVSTSSGAAAPAYAFVRKPLRPHCLRPDDTCGGEGRQHCWPCVKALAATGETADA